MNSIRGDSRSRRMQTLEKFGVLNEMINESNSGRYVTLFNNDFSPIIQMCSPPVESLSPSSIRIARSKLREILLKNLPSSEVRRTQATDGKFGLRVC
jgi:hypothetical protein